MSSQAQWVRAILHVFSRLAGTATSSSAAQSVRPEFGQRGFLSAAGQKIKAGNT